MAGMMISIGGSIYLLSESKVIGAFLFGIGLLVILVNELCLYTGRIGYVVDNKPSYLIQIGITLIGNLIGTIATGLLLLNTRIGNILKEHAQIIVDKKLDDNLISILILSIFCGMLMYIAVNSYKTLKNDFAKTLIVFLCVMVFILSGFEHCVANMYYFTISQAWSINSIVYLLIMILGNSIGAIDYALSLKYCKTN
jgi:formate/nitrite transporter FocA (FNT family)